MTATQLAHPSAAAPPPSIATWLTERTHQAGMRVRRADLGDLDAWGDDPETGAVRHRTRRFFSVEGLDVQMPGAVVPAWCQPIIRQPEIGILGILTARFDGVRHFLMQAKIEPGNRDGCQLSPTVQATRSNYTAAHGGRPVPYLDLFRDAVRPAVVADVRQSEHGSWFLGKRNRNMIVETTPDLDVADGFRWYPLAAIHGALAVDDLVAMDARTTLSCLPTDRGATAVPVTAFGEALRSSVMGDAGRHTTAALLSLITEARSETEVRTTTIPLAAATGWTRTGGAIGHERGAFFEVLGVDVEVSGREVGRWSQPMIAAIGLGLAGLLVTVIDGVLHALMQVRAEPGFVDVVELAPTVQCIPASYRHLPAAAQPPFLDLVGGAAACDVRFDTTLSEDGGRLFHTRTRHVVVETDAPLERPGYVWTTVAQLLDLVRHSHYVDIQARSLLTCLLSLDVAEGAVA